MRLTLRRHQCLAAAVCLAAALPAPPAAAQSLDSLFIHAAARARARAEQLAAGQRPDGGANNYAQARAALDSAQWADASLMLQAALQRNRNNPLYNGEYAYANARLGRWDEAGDGYAAAARLQGANAWWVVGLGAVRLSQERWADAAATFELAVNADSGVIDPRFAAAAGMAYFNAGDRSRALDWYRRATAGDSSDATSFLVLAQIYHSRADTAAGGAAIRRFLALRPGDAFGSAVYASFLAAGGRTDSALAYARVAARDTSLTTTRPYLADTYVRVGATQLLRHRDIPAALTTLRTGRPLAHDELVPYYDLYIGQAELQALQVRFNDLQESEDCAGARGLDSLIANAETYLRGGRVTDTARVDVMLRVLTGYRPTAQQMQQRFCDPARQRRAPAPPRRRP